MWAATLVLACAASSPRAAEWVYDGFGAALVTCGDFDGDGCEDFAVGDPVPDPRSREDGSVWIVSGRTLAVLRHVAPRTADRWFGVSIAWLPHSSRDPRGLFVVGSVTSYDESTIDEDLDGRDAGRIHVVRSDGTLVAQLDGDGERSRFGAFVRAVPDLDDDGDDDFLVGEAPARRGARVTIRSGRTLDVITALSVAPVAGGSSFDPLVTGTGAARTLVCSEARDTAVAGPGGLVAFRRIERRDGAFWWPFTAWLEPAPRARTFGAFVSDLGDVDGDGFADVVIGGTRIEYPDEDDREAGAAGIVHARARVVLASTKDGSTLRSFEFNGAEGPFGASAALSTSAAWRTDGKDRRVVLVTCAGTVESSRGSPMLCAFDLETGALVDFLALPGFGAIVHVVTLRDAEQGERIVATSSDLDPVGSAGTLLVSPPGEWGLPIEIGRAQWIAESAR